MCHLYITISTADSDKVALPIIYCVIELSPIMKRSWCLVNIRSAVSILERSKILGLAEMNPTAVPHLLKYFLV